MTGIDGKKLLDTQVELVRMLVNHAHNRIHAKNVFTTVASAFRAPAMAHA